MAVLKQRLHRKNSSGSYDAIHLETSSEVVIRPDGTTVEAALTELKTSVSNGKSAVASAITDKGVSTSATAEFATMATNIRSIPQLDTSDANAVAANILSGKTAYVKGSKITGSMTNRGAVSQALNCGGSYTIPAGYHNGSGKVTANSLASQTSATASAADIVSGKTAWVNGSKITGTSTSVKITGYSQSSPFAYTLSLPNVSRTTAGYTNISNFYINLTNATVYVSLTVVCSDQYHTWVSDGSVVPIWLEFYNSSTGWSSSHINQVNGGGQGTWSSSTTITIPAPGNYILRFYGSENTGGSFGRGFNSGSITFNPGYPIFDSTVRPITTV